MVPSFFHILDRFPISTNGKVDTKLLPKPVIDINSNTDSNTNSYSRGYSLLSPVQEIVISLFGEILRTSVPALQLSPESNFFQLGGHSLLAMQLMNRIQSKLGISFSLVEFFQQPTVAGLARLIEQR